MATSGAGSSSVGSELPDDLSQYLNQAYQNFSPWPPRVSTTATQLEINVNAIDDVDVHELDELLHSDKDVSQSDDSTFGLQFLQIIPSTSENEVSQQPPGAVGQKNSLPIASDERLIKNHKKATRSEQASETLSRREVVSQSDDSAIDVQNHEKVTHGEKASVVSGPCPPKSNEFFLQFVCGYLLKRADAGDYIELRENPPVLHWKDLDEISDIYCDYKDQKTNSDKKLNRKKKNRLDNIKNIIKLYEKGQPPSLTRVGSGTMYGKEFLVCEIKDSALWCLLKRSFRLMKQENSRANRNGQSLDTSELDASQSDGQLYNKNHDKSLASGSEQASKPSPRTEVVSRSDDLTARLSSLDMTAQTNLPTSKNEISKRAPQLATAVDVWIAKLTIFPNQCGIKGGEPFIIRADHLLQEGTYYVEFSGYGSCKARGDGTRYLNGCDNIPAAKRSGTHWITVNVFDETGQKIGNVPFQYKDTKTDQMSKLLSPISWSMDGPDSRKKSNRRKIKASSESAEDTGCIKKFKSGAVDKSMLVYFCDEMAKIGDEHFFSALIKLGFMGEVLDDQCEYYKDFAATALEHGHNELAETIETFSRELPCDRHMEALTFRRLFDAVQKERSLGNSDTANSSNSDHTSNSYSSAYYGDCDSEDTRCSTNGSLIEFRDEPDAVSKNDCANYSVLNEERNSVKDDLVQEPEPVSESNTKIQWRRTSIRHRSKLSKLANILITEPSKATRIGPYSFCLDGELCIGNGSGGTRVYVGFSADGYEVAIKRIDLGGFQRLCDNCDNEKAILTCPNVQSSRHIVDYHFYYADPRASYLVLDLHEENLRDYILNQQRPVEQLRVEGPRMLRQILYGLKALHSSAILHRDLKPSNILVNMQGEMVLSDFGISRTLPREKTTYLSGVSGTEGWMAAESLPTEDEDDDDYYSSYQVRYKKQSDIQVVGMLAYYILTKGRHPYGPRIHRNFNISRGKFSLEDLSDPFAKDLITWMLQHDFHNRPNVDQCLKHPYLRTAEENFNFVTCVANQREILSEDATSIVVTELNRVPALTNWLAVIEAYVMAYITKHRRRKYANDATCLLRFIRNMQAYHCRYDNTPPIDVQQTVVKPQEYFARKFPTLPAELHRIIRRHIDWTIREDLKEFF